MSKENPLFKHGTRTCTVCRKKFPTGEGYTESLCSEKCSLKSWDRAHQNHVGNIIKKHDDDLAHDPDALDIDLEMAKFYGF